jgi:hypothetical protein
MATVKAVTAQEVNAEILSGVKIDSTLIGSAGVVYNIQRNAPVVILTGTQTASLSPVILDLAGAKQGDTFIIKKYTTAIQGTGASQIHVVSGSSAGAIVGAMQVGTATPNEVRAIFDGVAWR